MSLLFMAPDRDRERWKQALLEQDPNLDLHFWPDIDQKDSINFIVSWDHPSHTLNQFPNLQAVASLGAGVDHILNDPQLPDEVSVCRTITPRLKREMTDYMRTGLYMHQRHILTYLQQQRNEQWNPAENLTASELDVGLMGLGTIGKKAARWLADDGFRVRGWSRSSKSIDKVDTFHGNGQKEEFLDGLDAVICLLPLTDETEDVIDLELFKAIKNDGMLINLGRGEHLVDEDLVYALDRGLISWAMLDVFEKEPLPADHPFWSRSDILITPHIGGITPPKEAAEVIIENYKRAMSGMELLHTVDPRKGY